MHACVSPKPHIQSRRNVTTIRPFHPAVKDTSSSSSIQSVHAHRPSLLYSQRAAILTSRSVPLSHEKPFPQHHPSKLVPWASVSASVSISSTTTSLLIQRVNCMRRISYSAHFLGGLTHHSSRTLPPLATSSSTRSDFSSPPSAPQSAPPVNSIR